MAYKNLFLCFLLLLFAKENLAQVDTANTLRWSKDYKLTWDDFQGVADSSSDGGAATSSQLVMLSRYTSDTSVSITVIAFFFRKKSWTKVHYQTTRSLKHEQGHFDITEIFARKLNIVFSKYTLNRLTVSEDIKAIFNKYSVIWSNTQNLYDEQTANHRNVVKQKEWDKKIAQWLSEYPE